MSDVIRPGPDQLNGKLSGQGRNEFHHFLGHDHLVEGFFSQASSLPYEDEWGVTFIHTSEICAVFITFMAFSIC